MGAGVGVGVGVVLGDAGPFRAEGPQLGLPLAAVCVLGVTTGLSR